MEKRPEIRYINSVVCGSCAYELEVKRTPQKRVKLPKARRAEKKLIVLDPVSIVSIAVACVLLVLLTVGFVSVGVAMALAHTKNPY